MARTLVFGPQGLLVTPFASGFVARFLLGEAAAWWPLGVTPAAVIVPPVIDEVTRRGVRPLHAVAFHRYAAKPRYGGRRR